MLVSERKPDNLFKYTSEYTFNRRNIHTLSRIKMPGGFPLDIHLEGISKTFFENGSQRVIFKGLDTTFPSERFSVIVGKSGVGKSTLLNLISGIDVPDAGIITIGGQAVTGMNDSERTVFRRRHMGIIFQFFNLIPVLNVIDNVTIIARLDNMPEKHYMKNAMTLLERTGLSGREKSFPDTLSGGERQRVAIVRALVNDPDVILADEPTGNLDTETGRSILKLISTMAKEQRKTLIMVTHSPDAVGSAEHIFTVDNQRLIRSGPGEGGL